MNVRVFFGKEYFRKNLLRYTYCALGCSACSIVVLMSVLAMGEPGFGMNQLVFSVYGASLVGIGAWPLLGKKAKLRTHVIRSAILGVGFITVALGLRSGNLFDAPAAGGGYAVLLNDGVVVVGLGMSWASGFLSFERARAWVMEALWIGLEATLAVGVLATLFVFWSM